jgi:hypothetical protein
MTLELRTSAISVTMSANCFPLGAMAPVLLLARMTSFMKLRVLNGRNPSWLPVSGDAGPERRRAVGPRRKSVKYGGPYEFIEA